MVLFWVNPGVLGARAQPGEVFFFTGLAIGLVLINAVIAALLLNRELQRTFSGIRVALDQFSRGVTPIRPTPLPQDELGRLLGEIYERLNELAALRETTRDLTAELEMPRLLQIIAERASTLLGVTAGVIYEADWPRRKLRLLAAVGARPDPLGAEMDFGEGVAGRVADTGQSLVVHDYHRWQGRSERFSQPPLFDVLGVPMRWHGQLIGVLNLEDEMGGRVFTERDVALAEQFASQAAAAIQNARLFQSTRRQVSEFSILHEVARAAVSTTDLAELIPRAMEVLQQHVRYTLLGLYLLDPAAKILHLHPSFLKMFPEVDHLVEIPVGKGVTGQVAATGQPARLGDVRQAAGYLGVAATTVSELCVPLKIGERVIGVLNAEADALNAFADEDERLLTIVAGLLAPIIENARLYERDRQRLNELSLLTEIALTAISASSFDEIAEQAVQVLQRRLGYDIVGVELVDESGRWLRAKAYAGLVSRGEDVPPVAVGTGLLGRAIRLGRAVRVDDVSSDPDYIALLPAVRSELTVPLKVADRIIGVLNTESLKIGAYRETDEQLLTVVAGMLAPMIDNARLRGQAEQHARELDMLVKAQAAASASLDLNEVLTAIVEQVGRALDVTSAYVVEVDEAKATVVAEYYSPEASPPERVSDLYVAYPVGSLGRVVEALRTGQPTSVGPQDEAATDFERDHIRRYGGRSTLVVPLIRQGRPLGYVRLWESRRDRVFTEEEVQLAQALAGHAAAALENAKLYQAAQRRAEQMRLVNEVGRDIAGILDVSNLLTQVSQRLEKAFGYYHAKVGLLEEGQIVFPTWFDAQRNRQMPAIILPVDGPGLIAWVVRNAQPRHSLDVKADLDHLPNVNFPETRSEVVVPLIAHNRLIGVLDVQSDQVSGLGAEHLSTLEAISGQLAMAVDNAKLYQAAQRQAEQMRLINEVGQDIAGILDIEVLLDKVGQRLEAAFGYYHANAGLIEDKEIVFRAHYNERRQTTLPEIRLLIDGPGVISWVARHSQARLVSNAQADPLFMPYPFFPETHAELALPLVAQDRIIGVLEAQSDRVNGLGPEDLATLEVISGQLAVAVENARLYAEARQRAEEVSALLSTTLALSSSMQLDRRLDSIAHFARRLVEADSCTIYKLEAEAKLLRPIVVHDKYAEQISSITIPLGEGITGYVALSGKGELVNRVELDPRGRQVPGTPRSPENLIAVPLKVNQRVTGVMTIHREGMRGFKPHDLNLISSFAAQAAVAIGSAELYQELEARADSLQTTYDELAQMDRLKDEMMQNISHELRTPITFLKSYVDLLLAGQLGPLLPEQEKGLRVVADKTNTLVRLVNDILTLQVVSPETLNLIPLDLVTIARAAADGVAAAAQQAGLHLSAKLPETPVIIRGDSLRLSQVFDNLLSNAMRFTDPGGDVQLNILPDAAAVRVEVRDTGVGIATDKLRHVFDRFYQVDGVSMRRRGGIGLGLSICKQIVESHGGRMGVESKVGRGSCFYFILPLPDQTPPAAPKRQA